MRLAQRFLVLPFAMMMYGCAAPVHVDAVSGPDGKTAYVMKCSGFGRDRSDCVKEAGTLCSSGYKIVDDSSEISGAVVTRYTIIAGHRNYMTVECK